MRLGRRTALLGSLAGLAAAPGQPVDRPIPIETRGGRRCILRVIVDGKPGKMLLDTGAERTIISRAGLARLGLRLDPWVGSRLEGAGGRFEEHQNAVAGTITAGSVRLVQRAPGEPFSMPVTSLDFGEADGLIGGDVLMHQTVDLDIPAQRLALLPPNTAMPGATGPGATAWGAVRLALLRRNLLLAPIRVDGHALTALLDTGAANSLINARGLYKLGLTPAGIAGAPAVPSLGLGGAFTAHALRFTALSIGPVRVPHPVLLLADVPEAAHDLLLGLDVLGRQRFVISYASLTLGFPPS